MGWGDAGYFWATAGKSSARLLLNQFTPQIPRLGRGQALVREIGLGNYTDAFLVNLDLPAIAKDAIDELTRARLMTPKLAGLPASPSKPLSDYPAIMAELHASSAKRPPPTPSG